MKLTLGFSPCPNDTFIFDAMVNNKIDTCGLEFDYVLEDVETLNNWALEGKLDITKLSFSTFLSVVNNYSLLHSGSALGSGVGPLLVAKDFKDLGQIDKLKIAIPGKNTTANLLLTLAFPNADNTTEMLFSEIEDAVLKGNFDAGLVIHEGRFTYQQKGLTKLLDLGEWWEKNTGAPIPLGGIVVKRNMDSELCKKIDKIIKDSIAYSWKNFPILSSFVTQNALEMEEDVMRQHIQLYVNNYTNELGQEGRAAVEILFERAKSCKIIENMVHLPSIFY